MPRTPNHWGASKSPCNVASTFLNTVHFLPKDLKWGFQTCVVPLEYGTIDGTLFSALETKTTTSDCAVTSMVCF